MWRRRAHSPARPVAIACALATLACALVAATSPAASSSNLNVSMTVSSATSITPGTCVTGSAGITRFGTIQPSQSFVAADCTIGFGSTNDTSKLLVTQSDRAGQAMFRFGDGEMHNAFGGGGTGYVSHEPGGTDFSSGVARQSTGDYIVTGYAAPAAARSIFVGRFSANGDLDTGFGTSSGYTFDDLGTIDDANDVELFDDDSIVVGGNVDNGGGTGIDLVLIKYTKDGAHHPGFGVGGIVELHLSGTDEIHEIELTDDGKILAAGESGGDIAVMRFEGDGDLDPTFGINGVRLVNTGTDDHSSGMTIGPDGKIYVAGHTHAANYRWTVVRLDADGTVLSSTVTPVGSANSYAYDVNALSTGEILANGISQTAGGGTDFTVVKYTSAGVVDTTWGTNGVVTRSMAPGTNSDTPLAAMLLPDDRLFLGGNADHGSNRWTAARLLPSGAWDTTFGTSGTWTSFSHAGSAKAVVLGPDGRIVLVGSGNNGITLGMLGSTTFADYDDRALPGDTDWSTGANTFGACLRTRTGANVVATWAMTGACGVDDNDPWMPIPTTTGSAGAEVARTNLVGASGSATLRFGIRVDAAQRPGTYFAPLDVTVLAPS